MQPGWRPFTSKQSRIRLRVAQLAVGITEQAALVARLYVGVRRDLNVLWFYS